MTDPMTDTTTEGWTPWDGGECPVAPGIRVHIRYFDGLENTGPASKYKWDRSGKSGDIIAYRIVSPGVPDPKKLDGWGGRTVGGQLIGRKPLIHESQDNASDYCRHCGNIVTNDPCPALEKIRLKLIPDSDVAAFGCWMEEHCQPIEVFCCEKWCHSPTCPVSLRPPTSPNPAPAVPDPVAAAVEAAIDALEAAQEELRLIQMKDCGVIYDTLLRSHKIPLALEKLAAARAALSLAQSQSGEAEA